MFEHPIAGRSGIPQRSRPSAAEPSGSGSRPREKRHEDRQNQPGHHQASAGRRKSFQKIAKSLSITEKHRVRSRVKRLVEEGVLDVTGLVDPEAMPDTGW